MASAHLETVKDRQAYILYNYLHFIPFIIIVTISLFLASKRQRKSMLLSELCVITVSVPAYVTLTQRGRGGQLKFRFSPYTMIELLRVAILKVGDGVMHMWLDLSSH